MIGRLSVIIPPPGLPISVDLVKQHTRITIDDDDVLLSVYMHSAVALVEAFLNRALLTQTLQWSMAETFPPNSWPLVPAPILILPIAMEWNYTHQLRRDIELPRSPVQSVDLVYFQEWGDTESTTLDTLDYDFDLQCDPARVRLHSDVPWSQRQFLSIQYVAGYGDTSDSVPVPIIHALLMTTAYLYEHRGDQESGDLPAAARSLLWQYRLATFW